MTDLTDSEWLAIEMAARGCVSGRLKEWPLLASAFRKLELGHDPMMWNSKMKEQAREAWKARKL